MPTSNHNIDSKISFRFLRVTVSVTIDEFNWQEICENLNLIWFDDVEGLGNVHKNPINVVYRIFTYRKSVQLICRLIRYLIGIRAFAPLSCSVILDDLQLSITLLRQKAAGLMLPQLSVNTTQLQQLVMRALLNDFAVIHHNQTIHRGNR